MVNIFVGIRRFSGFIYGKSLLSLNNSFKMSVVEHDFHKKDVDLSDLRAPYHNQDMQSEFSSKDPLKLFNEWFTLALSSDIIKEPNAMALATADKLGRPSSRYVLLKGYGKDGFRFFTNYESRKGNEISDNPHVALLFYWESLHRQIRIEGIASKLSEEESLQYFQSRPRSSQISAAISPQSKVIENKSEMLKKQEALDQQCKETNISKPDHWGGYIVVPSSIEFWCGRTNRLHDRIRFRKIQDNELPDEKLAFTGEDNWLYEYLAP